MAFRTEVEINGLQGSPLYSRLHWDSTGFDGQIGADAVANATHELWTDLAAFMHNQTVIAVMPEVALVDDSTRETTAVFITSEANIAGALSTERIASGLQLVAQHRSGQFVGGREVRGRTFIPGLTESANDSGRPIGATRTAAAAAFDTWFTGHDPQGGILSIHGFFPAMNTTIWTEFGFIDSRRV